MLRKCTSFREMNGEKLLEIYSESNRAEGADDFREETPERQKMLAEERFCDYLRQDFFSVRGAAYYIWEENGVYTSALRTEPYQDGLLIAGLETRPDYRKSGFATRLLEAALDDLSGQGNKIFYSHIRKDNASSRRIHQKIGFTRLLDYGALIDGTVDRRYDTFVLRGKELKKYVDKSDRM